LIFAEISSILLDWYYHNRRDLPWRVNLDPYSVWVSEVMLQQTRVETVIPYYEQWMTRFPTLSSLSNATLQEVLNQWEGLGYYGRARNLHKSSQMIMHQMNGIIPQEVKNLVKLPGVGQYTAAAIAAIAFSMDELALDGNLRRVFARIFNIKDELGSRSSERIFQKIGRKLIPKGFAGDFNQALMDFGSLICIPKDPLCNACPIKKCCKSYALGVQKERPVIKPKAKLPHHIFFAAVIIDREKVLINQRPTDGLLGGLWEFPEGKLETQENPQEYLLRRIQEKLNLRVKVIDFWGENHHTYTHFKTTKHVYLCQLIWNQEVKPWKSTSVRWVPVDQLIEFPMGKLDRKIATKITTLENNR
jgi:A/G-specific adenine glycosylase